MHQVLIERYQVPNKFCVYFLFERMGETHCRKYGDSSRGRRLIPGPEINWPKVGIRIV